MRSYKLSDCSIRIWRGILIAAICAMPIVAATPLTKTGPCPALPRITGPLAANTIDRWTNFGVRPTPADSFPSGTIQASITPAQAINCFETAEGQGLMVQLWASEEMQGNIKYLQHFTFDERGRLWGVEPASYPSIIRTASNSVTDQKFQGGLDRIVIMEDTDGDKVMDSFKVFKDGLNLPQSIEVVKGGVIVTMVPYIAYFPNNNDVAGAPQILFSGLGPNGNHDTHSSISSLMYGIDNWIYGITGWMGCNVGSVNCTQGRLWRFQHQTLGHAQNKFEVWTQGPYNAWGVGQSEDGQLFQSGATGTPHINHSVRKGVGAIDIRHDPTNANNHNKFYPITGDRYLAEGSNANFAGGGRISSTTAVSGLQFYTARLFPKKYWGRFAFTCEGASKLCNQDSMVVSENGGNTGSTWRAIRMPGYRRSNLIASTDAWFAPVYAKTGPDGAVWVMDWNNYLFLHNPLKPEDGTSYAWVNPLRTKTTSRIYRVAPANGETHPVLNLTNAPESTLISTLRNANMHWRLSAQKLLLAKDYTETLGAAFETLFTTDKGVDEMDNNPNIVHALWTLHGLGQFTSNATKWLPILKDLLLHPAWGVRRNVLMVMPRTTAGAQAISDNCSVNDSHGHVRLQALVAFAETSAKPANPKAMWTTFQNVDTTATGAFRASGLTSAADRPCTPTLAAATAYVPTGMGPPSGIQGALKHDNLPRNDLRIAMRPQGFALLPHGQLASGEFSLYDIAGKKVFVSKYDSKARAWSKTEMQGAKAAVYTYTFMGVDGSRQQGRLSVSGF
jgi:uncharacterized protein